MFHNRGVLPQVIVETWKAIWQYFESHPEVQRAYTADYQVYDLAEDGSIEIHIAVV